MGRFLDWLLSRFASLRLAIFVILSLAAYLAIGTAFESRYGQRAASEVIYRSPAFIGVLALLAINVMAAAVVRIPWKRHQTGFVITHLGIEVLLLGCLIGAYAGIDGRIVLRPGESGDVIDLEDQQIAVLAADDSPLAVFPLRLDKIGAYPSAARFAATALWPWAQRPISRRLGEFQGVTVELTAWHPAVRSVDGKLQPVRVPADRMDEAVAAARVKLSAMGKSRETWLVRGEKPVEVPTPGGPIRLGYGFEAAKLPFTLTLARADRDNQPGKTAAAKLSATIAVGGVEFPVAPNAPAVVNGMTIYLSGVETIDGQTHAFLAVRKDPGWIVKYAGCALIVGGTVMMFVIRRRDVPLPALTVAAAEGTNASGEFAVNNSALPLAPKQGTGRGRGAAVLAVMVFLILPTLARADEQLRMIPVQHDGRVKPLDTMAREIVRTISGRETRDSLRTLLKWADLNAPNAEPIILVNRLELRARLGMPADQKHIAPDALMAQREFQRWADELIHRRKDAEEHGEDAGFTALEKDALAVVDRFALLRRVQDRRVFRVVPAEGEWRDITDAAAPPELKQSFANLLNAARWDQSAEMTIFGGAVFDQVMELSGWKIDPRQLRREVTYHAVRPFRWVGMAYGLALVILIAGSIRTGAAIWPGVGALGVAIVLHAGAFAWRSSITGWAPVTNMYESIIWVGGMAAVMGLILSVATRAALAAVAGTLVAVLACIVGDIIPAEYGQGIRNLAPVLQSNFWLTVHVLTIVSSYAAFAVALVLGNVGLWQMSRRFEIGGSRLDDAAPNLQPPTSNLLYRCLQVGVVLVAAGTVLGGVWADVSWGRFWGWDPKEVWALIVLLSYLALLHARRAGWVGPFGLAAGSVLCFLTVLMSWYGVNFVLGVGLHSYGFGAGGLQYVLAYAAIQILFVAWAGWKCRTIAVRMPTVERNCEIRNRNAESDRNDEARITEVESTP